MLRPVALTLAACLAFAPQMTAQTVGVTLVNDFWITPGGAPNATSCAPLTVNTPLTLNLNVSATPSGTVWAVLISFCGCTPCAPFPAMGTSGCLPPPSATCPSSNQFLEANFFSGCATVILIGGSVNSAGFGTFALPVPPVSPPLTVGMQSIFFGPAPCVVAPFGLLFSPAWSVTLQ